MTPFPTVVRRHSFSLTIEWILALSLFTSALALVVSTAGAKATPSERKHLVRHGTRLAGR